MKQALSPITIAAAILGVFAVQASVVLAAEGFIPAALIQGPEWQVLPPDEKPANLSQQIVSLLQKGDLDAALKIAMELTTKNSTDPYAFNMLGGVYMAKGDAANARKNFEKAIQLRANYLPALMNLGQLDLREKDPASARKRFESILATDPKNVRAMMGLGQVELDMRNPSEAVAWLERAKLGQPDQLLPRLQLGKYYVSSGNYAKAMAEFNEVLAIRPGNPDALDLLGQTQTFAGQNEQAASTYRRLVLQTPDWPLAHLHLATALIATNRNKEAATSLKRALQLQPDYIDAMRLLAGLEVGASHYSQALQLAKQIQKLQPGSSIGFVLEGDIATSQRRHGEALQAYEKAFSIAQTPLIVMKRHSAQMKVGQIKEAEAAVSQWLLLHPDDIETLHYLAAENLALGKNDLAIEQYGRILKILPDDITATNNLALLYQREKDPRAITTAQRAYSLKQTAGTADTLGWIKVEQGNLTEGLQLLRQAAALDSRNLEVKYHLAVALARSGDKAQARRDLEQLLAERRSFPQRDDAAKLLKGL